MVVALAAYSDSCTAPSLQPDCPFYELGPQGPVCGEQCKDVLGEVGSGGLPQHVVDVDSAYVAVRRPRRVRPRRGPTSSTRPFDAREAFLADRDLPRDKRGVSSLLYELRALLTEGPDAVATPTSTGTRFGQPMTNLRVEVSTAKVLSASASSITS